MISVGPYILQNFASGSALRQTFSCRFGITSPQKYTRRSVSGTVFSRMPEFAMAMRAEGTKKIVLISCSAINFIIVLWKEKQFFGMIHVVAPFFSVL